MILERGIRGVSDRIMKIPCGIEECKSGDER